MHSGAASRVTAASERGATLVELLVVLVLLGVLATVAVPRIAPYLDRLGVRGAMQDVLQGIATARSAAATHAEYASVVVDASTGIVRVRCAGFVPFERDVVRRHGVQISVTRDSITFAPSGLGWGAANTTVIISRGGSSDTIVTSRLGRVRRS